MKKYIFMSQWMRLNDAAIGRDYFSMWTKVKCCAIQQWMLLQFQLNIAAAGLRKIVQSSCHNAITKQVDLSSNASDLCWERIQFESWLGHHLFLLKYFMVFLCSSSQILVYYLSLGHNHFPSHPIQFIIHHHPII